jgi:BASS family bile acid:Na+ symporter
LKEIVETAEGLLRACVILFMVGSLLGAGLAVTPRDALAPLRRIRFVALTLLVGWIVSPSVAFFLLQAVPLDQPYATALLLLALAPAAPFAPIMMQTARGDAAYIAAFMLLSTVATVVIMPVAVPIVTGTAAVEPTAIARPLVLFVLLPLIVGLAIRHVDRALAEYAKPPVAIVTNASGASLLVLIAVLYGSDVVNAVGSYAIATQVVFVAAVTLLAHAAGRVLRDDQRSVLTIGMCTRNLGAALAPLAAVERDARAIVMIAIAAPVTLAASALAARWLARRKNH